MRGWSLLIGRVFGVEVRIHLFFLVLLGLSVGYATAANENGGRGVAMWLLLVLAVAVREVARAFGAAWWGLKLRGLLLLPTGSLTTYESHEPGETTDRAAPLGMQWRMALVGPAANLLFGFVVGALALTLEPRVNLAAHPLAVPGHLLRALVWVNLLLCGLNLLPCAPLDGGRVLRGVLMQRQGGMKGLRTATNLGQMVSFLLMSNGLYFNNVWVATMGFLVLLASHMEEPPLLPASEGDFVKMRDVMLTEYSTLSASDTLEDALQRSVHVLQDVFPVIRGVSMVGAVSRQSIVEALATEGNGYVQGVMTRSFQSAHPDDSLVKTLRRVMSGRGAQLLPVLEGERVVGIITPQNLAQSVGMLNRSRRLLRSGN